MADKSKLPKMTPGKVIPTPWWKPEPKKKKKAPKKITQAGSMDDNAMERAKKRKDALKEAGKL